MERVYATSVSLRFPGCHPVRTAGVPNRLWRGRAYADRCRSRSNSGPDLYSHRRADGHSHAHFLGNPFTPTDRHACTHRHSYAHAQSHPDSQPHCDPDGHAVRHADRRSAHGDAQAQTPDAYAYTG
jgi:hypothetical protein